MKNRRGIQRVLAIDPTSRGFGFAVLEGSEMLIDWGVVHQGTPRNQSLTGRFQSLMDRYLPHVVVIEDLTTHSRRSTGARTFLDEINGIVFLRKKRCYHIPKGNVRS